MLVVMAGIPRWPAVGRLATLRAMPYSPAYVIAFVAVIAAGGLQTVNSPASPGALAVVIVAGALLAVLGTLGLRLAQRPAARRAAISGLIGLGMTATIVSHGHAAMMLLAVASAGVLTLEGAAGLWLCASCAAAALAAFAVRMPLGAALIQAEVTYVSGIAFVIVFARLIRRERAARGEVERLAAQAEQLAAEHERNRIARDIHDGLGHYLTSAHIQLEAANGWLDRDRARAGEAIETAQRMVREGLAELRRSVTVLRGGAAGAQLIDAIRGLARDAAVDRVATHVRVEGTPRRIADPAELALYRAAQEALTNCRRHARASRIDVILAFDPARVRLTVDDDGLGTEPAGPGAGLAGLRERAQLIGGTLSITRAAGRGFTLEMAVPG